MQDPVEHPIIMRHLGKNHQDNCEGKGSYLSGEGYNRVWVCGCGAEDHAPDPKSLPDFKALAKEFLEERFPDDNNED